MRVLKIAVANADRDFCELLTGYVRFQKDMEIIGISGDGEEMIQLIQEKKPDVLVMDLMVENSMTLLSYIRQKEEPIHILAFSQTKNNQIAPVSSVGKGDHFDGIEGQIANLMEHINGILEPSPAEAHDWALELRVSDLLRQFGIPAHIQGYRYLRKAIVTVVKTPEAMDAVTKMLYPDIAKCYGTTASCVERGIRKAIEVAWERGNIDYLHHYFGYTIKPLMGRPTNSEFIATVSDILYLQQDQDKLLA